MTNPNGACERDKGNHRWVGTASQITHCENCGAKPYGIYPLLCPKAEATAEIRHGYLGTRAMKAQIAEHEEKPSADLERLMFALYHEPMPEYEWTEAKIKELIAQERLAWEKNEEAWYKEAKENNAEAVRLEKKVAELEDECRRHLESNAMITKRFDENYEHSKELKNKLDEAVKALEWYAKNNTKTHWQRKRAEEALRKIKEM